MDQSDLNKYRDLLRLIIARLQGDASAVSEQVRAPSGGQAEGNLSNAPMHLGDMGTDEYLRDLNAALLEHAQFQVDEVRAALDRVDQGTFGRCEECGQPIAAERLDALPYARYCTRCAETAGRGTPANLNAGRSRASIDDSSDDDTGEAGDEAEPARPRRRTRKSNTGKQTRTDPGTSLEPGDVHAAGTPGGGTALGSLAGTNAGRGDPEGEDLEDAMGSGTYDVRDAPGESPSTPESGRAGGAVGGTPAGKRTRGDSAAPKPDH